MQGEGAWEGTSGPGPPGGSRVERPGSESGFVPTTARVPDDGILAHCMICRNKEAFIQNWQKTEWADGMMEPVPVSFDA